VSYDDAVRDLYQAKHDEFVAERKRLADALRAAGDRAGAAKLVKLARPPVSAWVVNQLYWHARDAFDELFATAARLREGDLGAAAAHREVAAKLRQRAANVLADAGHAASEVTLRRVTANLAAIAAAGGFAPDQPGALAGDRAPPGFEALGGLADADAPRATPRPAQPIARPIEAPRRDDEKQRAEEARRLDEQRAERQRAEERAKRRAERERVAAALRTARGDVEAGERRVTAIEQELRDAHAAVARQRAVVDDLERRLAAFGDVDG
jgi:hypothetical protein